MPNALSQATTAATIVDLAATATATSEAAAAAAAATATTKARLDSAVPTIDMATEPSVASLAAPNGRNSMPRKLLQATTTTTEARETGGPLGVRERRGGPQIASRMG